MQRIRSSSLATASIAVMAFFAVASANAEVVQLPTFRFFGLSTTVSVPDRGSAYLGGVSRSAMSSSEQGAPIVGHVPFAGRVFGNRAIAGRTEMSGASVSAFIHDFEAMDEEVLGQAAVSRRPRLTAKPGARNANVVARSAAPLPRSLPAGQGSDVAGRTSIVELRRQQQLHEQASQAEVHQAARQNFERARELAASGKAGLARVYLQQAAKQAGPQLRADIADTLNALGVQTAKSQTQSRPSNSLAAHVR